jgi:hypothetical protein
LLSLVLSVYLEFYLTPINKRWQPLIPLKSFWHLADF